MPWSRKIALVLSISSFLIFAIALSVNWIEGPGIENLSGEIKSSDLFQHYGAGTFVREGRAENLYQGGQLGLWIDRQQPEQATLESSVFNYVYPPAIAWVSAPFTTFSYPVFALAWLVLSICFYFFSGFRIIQSAGPGDKIFRMILLLGLPSLHYTLILGQNSCLSLLIIACSAVLLAHKQELLAGLVLSCLFYKPQFLPLLLAFMFIAGHKRFVGAAVLGSLAWLLLGLLICGWESYESWLWVLRRLDSGEQTQFAHLNQTLKMFVLNLMGQSSHPGKLAGILTTLLGLGLMGLAAWIAGRARRLPTWSPAHSLFLAAAVMTIASPYLMHYDLLLAAGWWLLCLEESPQAGWKPGAWALLFWIISLFSINTAGWPAPLTAPLMILYLAATLKQTFMDSGGKSRSSAPAQT